MIHHEVLGFSDKIHVMKSVHEKAGVRRIRYSDHLVRFKWVRFH